MIEFLAVAVIAVGTLVATGVLAVLVLALKLDRVAVAVAFSRSDLLHLPTIAVAQMCFRLDARPASRRSPLTHGGGGRLCSHRLSSMATVLLPVLLVALLVWFVVAALLRPVPAA